jgi:hypothetical protein
MRKIYKCKRFWRIAPQFWQPSGWCLVFLEVKLSSVYFLAKILKEPNSCLVDTVPPPISLSLFRSFSLSPSWCCHCCGWLFPSNKMKIYYTVRPP